MSGPDAFGDFVKVIDQHGQLAHEPGEEHHWLCPSHMTEEARLLADRIGNSFATRVGAAMAEDDLGSIGELAAAISADIERSGLDDEGKGQRWVELMAMSLGYWLDCMVVHDVMAETGATEDQCRDVALFREWLRRDLAREGAYGVRVRRVN
jgi:hypothetical protein